MRRVRLLIVRRYARPPHARYHDVASPRPIRRNARSVPSFVNSRRAFLATALAAASIRTHAAKATRPRLHRRVVTGVDASGRSVIRSDGAVPAGASSSDGGRLTSDLWLLKQVPPDLRDSSDPMADYALTAWPPAGGAVARIVTWPAGFEYPLHMSDTLDLVFVISGELELIVEGGSTILRAGDSVVQQGTKHAWRVRGKEPATFAGVLVSAKR